MREMESIHRKIAEFLAEDNLRFNLSEEIGTVIDEVPCIVQKRGFVPNRIEEESFRNKNKAKRKNNGFVCPASVNCGAWRCIDSQKNDWRNI